MPKHTEEQRAKWRAAWDRRYAKHGDRLRARKRAYYHSHPETAWRSTRRANEKRDALREIVWAKKSKPCADCGGSFPPYVMDYDHRDGSQKISAVSNLLSLRKPIEEIEAEIAKCDLVCANCHRLRTHKRGYLRPGRG